MEGALIFASGVARRFGGSQGKATMPFTVSGDKVGYAAAEGEDVKGEFWAPIWQRSMTVPELRRVIAEGRLSWRGKQATSGVDAAKALCTLGADRGFSHFERYVLAKRFGDSYLAVPVGPFVVTRQPADRVSLLRTTDTWVAGVRRQSLPHAAASALRRVDAAQMKVTQNPDSPDSPALLQDFLVELAALEWAISRNPQIAKNVREPIQPLNCKEWGPLLDDGTVEWRLAAALATQRDRRLTHPPTLAERRSGTANVLFRPGNASRNPPGASRMGQTTDHQSFGFGNGTDSLLRLSHERLPALTGRPLTPTFSQSVPAGGWRSTSKKGSGGQMLTPSSTSKPTTTVSTSCCLLLPCWTARLESNGTTTATLSWLTLLVRFSEPSTTPDPCAAQQPTRTRRGRRFCCCLDAHGRRNYMRTAQRTCSEKRWSGSAQQASSRLCGPVR